MRSLFTGPLPVFMILLTALLVRHGGTVPDAGVGETAHGFVAARALESLAGSLTPERPPDGRFMLAVVLLAFAGSTFFVLIHGLTANRLVAVATALLAALHPMVRPEAADALLVLLPVVLLVAGTALVDRALRARLEGRPFMGLEASALACFLAAGLCGPLGLVFPLFPLLVEICFRDGRSQPVFLKRALPRFVVHALSALGLGAILLSGAGVPGGGDMGPARAFEALLLAPETGALVPLIDLLGAAAGLVGLSALVLGLAGSAERPRYLLLHTGFATLWFLACQTPDLLPGVTAGGFGRGAAALGPAFLLSSAAWRAAMFVWERARKEWRAPGGHEGGGAAPSPESLRTVVTESVREVAPEILRNLLEPRLRDLVEEELPARVRTLLEEERLSRLPGPPVARGDAALREEAWRSIFHEGTPPKKTGGALGEAWTEEEALRNLFQAYVLPHLLPDGRVLEIGGSGGTFTALIAPQVHQVVCLASDRGRLESWRSSSGRLGNAGFVLSDGVGLGAVASSSVDLVVSADAFVRMDLPAILRHLREVTRVLRPGGRAILAFANLVDPEGWRRFVSAVEGEGEETSSAGDETFLTPEVVHRLVQGSGMRVESLHLSADEGNLLAVIERPPR